MTQNDEFNDVIGALRELHQAEVSVARRQDGPAPGRVRPRIPIGALIALALLVVAVVGVGSYLRLENAVTPTHTPSTPSPVAAATESPSPSPTPLATPLSEWLDLGYLGADWAAWSPDGQKLMIHTGDANAPTADQVITLTDRDGQIVLATYHGDFAIWVDSNTVLIYAWQRRPDGTVSDFEDNEPDLVNIDTGATTQVAIPSNAISNGHRSVAYTNENGPASDDTFQIWTDGSASAPLNGRPLSWSRDGTRLVVWHYAEAAGGATGSRPTGWLEVLQIPGGESIYADQTIRTDTLAQFDPSGRYVLYLDSYDANQSKVIDTTTSVVTVIHGNGSHAAWDSHSHLVVTDESRTARVYDPAGSELSIVADAGDLVVGSPDGAALALYFSEANIPVDTGRLTIMRSDSTEVHALPGADRMPVRLVSISPDDSRVLAISETDHGESVLLLVLTPTLAPSPSPTPSPTPMVTPYGTLVPPPDLSVAAWTFGGRERIGDEFGPFNLLFGRLDGRAFKMSAPYEMHTGRPADNGMAIAWWSDPTTTEGVVVTLDTATGAVRELLRSSVNVPSAELSPAGDEWWWIQSGSANELWRQSLPDGQPEKVADLRSNAYALQLSADGSKVAITENKPNGNSDCPSAEYRVWDSGNGEFVSLPTNVEELLVGLIGDAAFIQGWCSDIGVFQVSLGDGSRTQIASEDSVTPGVYRLLDGSPVLLYSGIEADQHEALFEYRPGDPAPRVLYVTGRDVPQPEDAQILVRNHDFGGINIKGWAPFFPGGSPYLPGARFIALRDVPRLLVNLADGTVAIAPQIQEPIGVSLPPAAGTLAAALHSTPVVVKTDAGTWMVGTLDEKPEAVAVPPDAELIATGSLVVMVTRRSNELAVGLIDPHTLLVRDIGTFPLSDEYRVLADKAGTTVYMQGSTYAVPGVDNGLRAFDVATGTSSTLIEPSAITEELTFRSGMALSPSGKTLTSSLCNQLECQVDLITLTDGHVRRLNTSLSPVALTDETALLHTGGDEGFRVMLYDLATDSVRQVADISSAEIMQVERLFAIDDGHFVASQTSAGRYDIFEIDAATGEVRSILAQIGSFESPDLELMVEQLHSENWILVGSDSSLSAMSFYDGGSAEVQVLDRREGSVVTTLTPFQE